MTKGRILAEFDVKLVDITEHVAAMYDALVGSMDWGSGMLDEDSIEAIVTVSALLGVDLPTGDQDNSYCDEKFTEQMPDRAASGTWTSAERDAWYKEYQDWKARRKAHIDSCYKQNQAAALDKLLDEGQ